MRQAFLKSEAMTFLTAFTSALPLRIDTRNVSSVTCRRSTQSSLSPTKPNESSSSSSHQGKRVPTFRKLQTRHRNGPASFRQAQATNNQKTSLQENVKRNSEELRFPNAALDFDVSVEQVKRKRRSDAISLADLRLGQQFKGRVNNIVRHGAYVDIGAQRDGLVHLRDMAIDFVHEVEDVARPGDAVTVWIKYVDPVDNVLGLTMIRPPLGFDGRFSVADIAIGSRHNGRVHRVTNYGAYIDIGAERMGFAHFADLWGRRPHETLQYLRIGQKITVAVQNVDTVRSHIQLIARDVRNAPLELESPVGKKEGRQILGKQRPDYNREAAKSLALQRHGEEAVNGHVVPEVVGNDEDGNVNEIEDVGENEDGEQTDSVSLRDDIDGGDLVEDDEFAFADEMVKEKPPSNVQKYADMVDEDTEFVGLDVSEIEMLRTLKSQIEHENQ